jgi:hypothetical protein
MGYAGLRDEIWVLLGFVVGMCPTRSSIAEHKRRFVCSASH